MSAHLSSNYSFPPIKSLYRETKPVVTPYEVDAFNLDSLYSMNDDLHEMLAERLNKLISVFKNCDFYSGKEGILVNDPLNSYDDVEETIGQFGFLHKKVDAGLHGSSFVINDGIVDLLNVVGADIKFKNPRLKEADNKLNEIIGKNCTKRIFNQNILDLISELKEKGRIVMMSDDPGINFKKINSLRSLLTEFGSVFRKANEDIRSGVIYVINKRAKKMGYTVNSQNIGGCIRMTLEKK